MIRRFTKKRVLFFACCCAALIGLAMTQTTIPNSAAEFSGREVLSVARIAHGGADYANLQNVTVTASGFVNAVAFGAVGANPPPRRPAGGGVGLAESAGVVFAASGAAAADGAAGCA